MAEMDKLLEDQKEKNSTKMSNEDVPSEKSTEKSSASSASVSSASESVSSFNSNDILNANEELSRESSSSSTKDLLNAKVFERKIVISYKKSIRDIETRNNLNYWCKRIEGLNYSGRGRSITHSDLSFKGIMSACLSSQGEHQEQEQESVKQVKVEPSPTVTYW